MTDKKDEVRPGDPEPKKVKSISHGWASDDDPMYQGSWNFLMGKNLNPHIKPKRS